MKQLFLVRILRTMIARSLCLASLTLAGIILAGLPARSQPASDGDDPIPEWAKYLAMPPPDETPQLFKLPVKKGSFPGERVAFSADGKEFYYTQVTADYSEHDVLRFKYVREKWVGPFMAFENLAGPALSPDGMTMFLEVPGKDFTSWSATRTGKNWSKPVPTTLLKSPTDLHNLQMTDDGTYFASVEDCKGGKGGRDIAKLVATGATSIMQSLGAPPNSSGRENDLYVARDQSYLIFSSPDLRGEGRGDLYISFKKSDEAWTKPLNLGAPINSPGFDFAPYVTADGKYLFFTRQSGPDSLALYWVRVDGVIARLRQKAGLAAPAPAAH